MTHDHQPSIHHPCLPTIHCHLVVHWWHCGLLLTPLLGRCSIYRMPSLACAAAAAVRRQQACGQGDVATGAGAGTSAGAAPADALDLGSTFYMLNPSGDLASTQAAFEERFASLPGWEVCGPPCLGRSHEWGFDRCSEGQGCLRRLVKVTISDCWGLLWAGAQTFRQ
jgi:Peptidase family C50